MTTERAQEFQMRITEEALALMIIHGESVSDAPSEEDISLAHYEDAVTLIGKAWGLPAEATAENLGLIQREKDVLRRIAAGENVNHILPEEELPMNASGMETLDNVWDLFETAVRLDNWSSAQRCSSWPMNWRSARTCWTGSRRRPRSGSYLRSQPADWQPKQGALHCDGAPLLFSPPLPLSRPVCRFAGVGSVPAHWRGKAPCCQRVAGNGKAQMAALRGDEKSAG